MKRINKIALSLVTLLAACSGEFGGAKPTGESCEYSEECDGNVCLTEIGDIEFPGGTCSADCANGSACVEDEICLIHNDTEQANCYSECSEDNQCREGYACVAINIWDRACLPARLDRG